MNIIHRLFCPQNEDLYKMQLLMGYIGLFVAVPCAPRAMYLASKVWHELTGSIMACIALKGLLDFVLTDYLLFRSVVLTSATVATVGLGLTIPMAFAADLIFQPETVISSYSIAGAILVGLGFLSVLDKDEVEVVKEEEENGKELPTCSSNSSQEGDAPTTNYVAFPVSWAQA
jgi:solute carrier family 35 protein F5